MKIYSIIIGFLLIGIIKAATDPIEMKLFKEVVLEEEGVSYYYAPIYEIDKMSIIANFYEPDVGTGNFILGAATFYEKPTSQDMNTARWFYPEGKIIYGSNQEQNYGFVAYQYQDLQLTSGIKYLALKIESYYNRKVTIYVKSKNHVYEVQLLEEIELRDCFDGYYFKIPAFSNDKMSIDATFYKPYYSQKQFFAQVYIKGLGSVVEDNELRYGPGWTKLEKYDFEERTNADFYSYPFETIEGVANLGFWFQCPYHDQVTIRIYSDTATKIALILLAIFLPLIIIGAVIGVLFKRGCFCRVRIN